MTQFVSLVLLIVGVLVGVAFFTLFERKLLGYVQLRKGPNKVGLAGLLQPFSDAIKLFTKQTIQPTRSNRTPFVVAPIYALSLSLICWSTFPSSFNFLSFDLSMIFFLCCAGTSVYLLFLAGWSSNSKYALIGSLRGVAQVISYEVVLVLFLVIPMIITVSFDWSELGFWQLGCWFVFVLPMNLVLFFISCLAETNRTPFDFAEGESELVSGYNTEYNRGGFSLLMLAEYASILFMSFLAELLYLGGYTQWSFTFFLLLAFTFVWTRGTLPRFRFDKLMVFAWLVLLPFAVCSCTLIGSMMLSS